MFAFAIALADIFQLPPTSSPKAILLLRVNSLVGAITLFDIEIAATTSRTEDCHLLKRRLGFVSFSRNTQSINLRTSLGATKTEEWATHVCSSYVPNDVEQRLN